MHDTAFRIGSLLIEHYLAPGQTRILDVGSYNVNGTLRDCAPAAAEYVGLDVEAGPGVDVVVTPGGPFPVDDNSFDLVIATSALEHDPAFWTTFLEMCRKAKDGGYIYLNVPSNGAIHRYPHDAWRFYPDSGRALAQWAQSQGLDIHLVESFTAAREQDLWNDFVAVFRKSLTSGHPPATLLHECLPSSNVWVENAEHMVRETADTEDMQLLRAASEGRATAEAQLGELHIAVETERAAAAEEKAAAEAQLGELRIAAEAERTALEQELANAQAVSATLTGRLAEVQSEVVQRQEEIAQITAEHGHTRAELDHAQAELEQSRAKVIVLQEELVKANGWVFKLAGERQEAEARSGRLSRELARIAGELESEQRAHNRTGDALNLVRRELGEARELAEGQLKVEIREIDRHRGELQAKVAELQRLADDLASQNNSLVQGHAATVADKQHAVAQLGQRYQELSTLTTMLATQENAAAEHSVRAEWLRQIAALSLAMPFWWHLLPRTMRRRRELKRLARRGLFDAERYYDLHPDVRSEGMDPLQHYLLHGLAEGRPV